MGITSREVVDIFLGFFEKHAHLRIPAASLVPDNDPTLLFINSGMAPLKPYFLGAAEPPSRRLCNVQPCIRTKDIEDVGDRHHLTLFEMLGSWSIGDYWKERAIELAFELLVEGFGFDQDKLYATVYAGHDRLGIPADEESAATWERVGLKRDQIVPLGEDNFWGPAGAYGPCGPCTEVFFDTGVRYGPDYVPGSHFDTESRYIEIWNAGVFMEYNLQPSGLTRLSLRSVDTGSGLERMVMILNGMDSVYETDQIAPVVHWAQDLVVDQSAEPLREAKLISDHLRAIAFILSDGVVPSNTGRGYIPRRLIRKVLAVLSRHNLQNVEVAGALDLITSLLGQRYPRLRDRREEIRAAFGHERREFDKILRHGFDRLETICARSPVRISGEEALSLFSTYGIPVDVIRDYVRDRGGEFDEAGFEQEYRKHQAISRGDGDEERVSYEALISLAPTRFMGYDELMVDGRIDAILVSGSLVDSAKEGTEVEVITDRTSFYAEGGGQVGDRGTIIFSGGEMVVTDTIRVLDTYHVHRGQVISGRITRGDQVQMSVSPEHRRSVTANHTATHLLQSALRTVLGFHVQQAGSKVEPERLRFDFLHPSKLTTEEKRQVEALVNQYIRRNTRADVRTLPYDEAIHHGALAFFGENYGETVRMVRFGDSSTELCGGCHVTATGDIGLFRIVSEGSVASGVRRIIAVTGEDALRYTQEREAVLEQVAKKLGTSIENIAQQVDGLVQRASMRQEPRAREMQPRGSQEVEVQSLPDGTPFLVSQSEDDPETLRTAALEAAQKVNGVVCLLGIHDGRVAVIIAVPKALSERFPANTILQRLLPYLDGRGGGKAHLAQGGGKNVTGVKTVVEKFGEILQEGRH